MVLDEIFDMLLDTSKRVPKNFFSKQRFQNGLLSLSDYYELPSKIDSVIEEAEEKLSTLLGHTVGVRNLESKHSLDLTIYAGFRLDERRKFIQQLEQSKIELTRLLDKPNSKSVKKDINYRIANVDRTIKDHKLGLDNIFISEEDARSFKNANNVYAHVFQYTFINPFVALGTKFQKGLDILEESGVPNIHLFRDLPKQTKFFFQNYWSQKFVPAASAYLIEYQEDALEDIIRLLPAQSYPCYLDNIENPDLTHVVESESFKHKIIELGLPLTETSEFIQLMGEESYGHESNFTLYRSKLLKSAKSFYEDQLSHDDYLYKWSGANALIEALIDENTVSDELDKTKFVKELTDNHLDDIISALYLDKKYPHLNSNKSILASRFGNYSPTRLKTFDPYDLAHIERLIPLIKETSSLLESYGVSLSIDSFIGCGNIENIVFSMNQLRDLLVQDDYVALSDNDYFKKFLSNKLDLEASLIFSSVPIPKLISLAKDVSLDMVSYKNKFGEEKINKIVKFIDEVGFDTAAFRTYGFFVEELGKNFSQFIRDFQATGNEFTRLPSIYSKFHNLTNYGSFTEDNLRGMMNYIIKQRSRDLINSFHGVVTFENHMLVASRFEKSIGKKDVVGIFSELHKSYSLADQLGEQHTFYCHLNKLPKSLSTNELSEFLFNFRKKYYQQVIGDEVKVPDHLNDAFDNIVYAYKKNSGKSMDVDVQPALQFIASNYLQEGPLSTFIRIRELENNKSLRKKFEKKGIQIDEYEYGILKKYTLKSDEKHALRLQGRIESEYNIIYNRLDQLGISSSKLSDDKTQQLNDVAKMLSQYEFSEQNLSLKKEILGHVQTIKSMKNSFKKSEDEVTFYVSRDPIEALHMGQYFRSCLSLAKHHSGVNAWASVMQVMDSNKNVIYAKGSNGDYVGRNRTVLTDEGILCTRFHQNGNYSIEHSWVDYLTAFGKHVNEDVLIPTMFTSKIMKNIFQEKEFEIKDIDVLVEPAYYHGFYGDGLETSCDDEFRVKSSVYVIPSS